MPRPLRAGGAALVDCAGYRGRVLSWLPGQVWARVRPDDAGPGATVLLQHDADGQPFWTLYRHLDRASLRLTPGQTVAEGDA